MAGSREDMEKIGAGTRFRSGDEAAKNGHKGGISSGVSRNRKKSMQDAVKSILSMQATNPKVIKKLSDYGVDEEDANYQAAVIIAMLGKALNGSERAAEFLRDTAGENPKDKAKKDDQKLKKDIFRYQKEKDAKALAGTDDTGNEGQTLFYLPEKDKDDG